MMGWVNNVEHRDDISTTEKHEIVRGQPFPKIINVPLNFARGGFARNRPHAPRPHRRRIIHGHVHSVDTAIGIRLDPAFDCGIDLLERSRVVFTFKVTFHCHA